jgi:hypothetical protein
MVDPTSLRGEDMTRDDMLVISVERMLRFGTENSITITSQGYCPNLCASLLKQEDELNGEYSSFTCPTCLYHARLSHITIERAHDVIIK